MSVTVGYVGVEARTTDVVVRFANSLPDDLYQIRIVGSGSNPLKNADGGAFNGGQDLTRKFTLDLEAQVVAVVPQPVTRNTSTNALSQSTNTIEVYFNANDPLDATTATNRFNYELIRTAGTATTTDDGLFNPTSVTYDSASGKAVLTFASGVLTTAGLYRLRVGNNDPLPLAPVSASVGTPGSSFSTAADLGALFPAAQGTQNVNVNGTVGGSPISVIYPGGLNDPGTRDLPIEVQLPHVLTGADTTGVIPVIAYNFKHDIGTVLVRRPSTRLPRCRSNVRAKCCRTTRTTWAWSLSRRRTAG